VQLTSSAYGLLRIKEVGPIRSVYRAEAVHHGLRQSVQSSIIMISTSTRAMDERRLNRILQQSGHAEDRNYR